MKDSYKLFYHTTSHIYYIQDRLGKYATREIMYYWHIRDLVELKLPPQTQYNEMIDKWIWSGEVIEIGEFQFGDNFDIRKVFPELFI